MSVLQLAVSYPPVATNAVRLNPVLDHTMATSRPWQHISSPCNPAQTGSPEAIWVLPEPAHAIHHARLPESQITSNPRNPAQTRDREAIPRLTEPAHATYHTTLPESQARKQKLLSFQAPWKEPGKYAGIANGTEWPHSVLFEEIATWNKWDEWEKSKQLRMSCRAEALRAVRDLPRDFHHSYQHLVTACNAASTSRARKLFSSQKGPYICGQGGKEKSPPSP